jgi:sugar phosphate isomerase/epimerase
MLKLATKFAPERTAFERAHRAGFHQAEIYLNEAILAEWDKVAELARHYPMHYGLHAPNKLDMSPETLRNMVELYRALHCRSLVIHQPHFDRHGEALLRLEPGLRVGIENHKLTPEGFDAWATKNPGLTLDVEHLWMFTLKDPPLEKLLEAVRDFLSRFGNKLRHVHMPGYVPGHEEHRPMYCSRDMIFRVLSLFAEFRYDGLVVSEVDLEYQNAEDLQMDVLLFRRWREMFEGK